MASRSTCKINQDLLPMKMHYFFVSGALGGVYPFVPVLGRNIGISATSVGLTFTVVQFSLFLSQPFFGCLADYFRNIKFFILCLLTATSISAIGLILIPTIHKGEKECANLRMEIFNHSHLSVFSPFQYDKLCIEDNLKENVMCPVFDRTHYEKSGYVTSQNGANRIERIYKKIKDNPPNLHLALKNESVKNKSVSNTCLTIIMLLDQESQINSLHSGLNTTLHMCEESINHCLITNRSLSEYSFEFYQFWVYMLLVVIFGVSHSSTYSLSDAACYEALGEETELYGKQRLWGTLGWALTCSVTGLWSDFQSGGVHNNQYYAKGIYVMTAFILIDALILIKVPFKKNKFSIDMCKDIRMVFYSYELIIISAGAFVIGVLTGLVNNYEFWFLEDLGASRTLLGLAIATQSLAGEIPVFFISGWFIRKFGHFNCLTLTFAGFALRLGLYSVVENPWFALPIDSLHGITFAIFHAAITAFATVEAPPGIEATLLGIVGGLSQGLGQATGSLLGGVGFDKLGGRRTFFTASIFSIICALCFVFSTRATNKEQKTQIDAEKKAFLLSTL